jgi:hypothetical protein
MAEGPGKRKMLSPDGGQEIREKERRPESKYTPKKHAPVIYFFQQGSIS